MHWGFSEFWMHSVNCSCFQVTRLWTGFHQGTLGLLWWTRCWATKSWCGGPSDRLSGSWGCPRMGYIPQNSNLNRENYDYNHAIFWETSWNALICWRFSSLLRMGSYTMPCNSRSSMTRSLSPWWNHRKPWYFYDLSRELKPFLIIRAGGEGQMDKCWALSYQIFFFSVLYNSARIQGGQIHRNANRQKWQGWGLKLCLDFISTYGSFNASGIYSGRVQRLLPITSTTLVRLEICVISWKQKDPWYPGWSV